MGIWDEQIEEIQRISYCIQIGSFSDVNWVKSNPDAK